MRIFLTYICVLLVLPTAGIGFGPWTVVGAVGLALIVLTAPR